MKDFSFVTNSHPAYIESLYQDFRKDPNSVDPDWVKFFEGFDFAVSNVNGKAATSAPVAGGSTSLPVSDDQLAKELGVYRLIQAYRKKGHLIAKTNPIRERKDRKANLDLASFGLGDADLKTEFYAGTTIGVGKASLEKIVAYLQQIYAGSVGLQYTYINDRDKAKWMEKEFESIMLQPLSLEQRKRILQKLNQGVIFEKFLHTKYIGQKRFGLEGGESTIPALDAIINVAAEYGVQESVIGMAHRGRLNVLANILGKTYEQIFNEFEGLAVPDMTMGSGDVKYHLGFRSQVTTPGGKPVNLQLMPNPSHLEVVDPIVVGFARSKADVIYNSDYDKILPILIHGDAAVAGQGIVYEVEQMSKLKGYYVGGSIHFVINNQIGFTTDFDDARSSDYCTSVASIVQAPVFHVNGDDAEAVVKVSQLAARYRQEFNEDVFIDMVCYRKHGHNEGDEPKFTQPSLYALIEKHANPREVYTQFLLNNGESEAQALAKEMEKGFWDDLQARLDEVKQHPLPYVSQKPEQWWQALRKATPQDFDASPVTAIKEDDFKRLFDGLMKWPENFVPLRKVSKLLQDKIKLYQDEGKVDWATGELLAYASLLIEGKDVRMSGEDVKRGTFSHRHAVLFDENTNETYSRLSHLQENQGKFRIYNSLLSEYGVLGFEYGYAMANPNNLVLWEAQYGDFVNGAQTVIDQYISSAEQKWTTQNGLVMLLPHGYEGGGPDHSNARPERFLQQCAEENMVITNITTAANFFHALRRQLTWQFRKPLINFSPKANLRHVGAYSAMQEFTQGGFKEVLDDPFIDDAAVVKKVLLCSGKMYFDLSDKQAKDDRKDVAIVRLEQLYPLPVKQLEAIAQKYKGATFFWVQEEPLNMGAAAFLQMNLKQINYGVISRNPSASTATGYAKVHAREQQQIIDTAFNI
ncbi:MULTISPECIES: 2-oxoglutarate dehydrogenase E1 component [Chitinophaga]|uniref:2-oxoglutarate dehydrogenase E1 component n=1 Tax=Chitinophaga TaxID=79328 RepID=UPI000DB94D69|nr:2-oxoglutarate dehydrogenase E1 component [Chitinophaga ginsengisegetis]MDR6565198.1 2-oxoglutarate dehydrogenase E1 component [Chitinophaga ginsengisegetis]MDR6644925.1 2-oxoglutarate dehydrogenase E1 component [Chitinophaga ginsengisegetis]MDR6652483.1 2-oxoglutarate dehydrogenase E1 component [Chitinophaga ginsengisegetis]